MIPLIIISAVILLIALLLFLPISLDIMYTDDFFMTVRFAGIRIFKIEPGKDIKKPKSDAESDKKAECGRVCAACKRVPRAAKAAFRAENGRIRSGGKIFSAA